MPAFLLLIVFITFHESTGEGQEFKLYQTTVDDWYDNDHATKLQDLIITEANSYCSSSPVRCSLPYWNETSSFQRSDVVVLDGYPREDVDLVVRFYILSNFSAEEPESKLSTEATKEIFLNIKSSLEDHMGTYVTYVGDDFYGIPIDEKTNRVIIPIAVGVLVVIAMVALALTIWSNNQEKERYKSFSKKSMRMSKNTNNRAKNNEHPDTENNLMKNNTDHQENKHLEHKHISPIANNQSHPSVSEDSYFNEVKHRYNELPPLNSTESGIGLLNSDEVGQPNLEESDTSPMKKHRKKKKSRKKKKKMEEKMSQENSALEESESDIFPQTHVITNVQPNNVQQNNVTADETIV